LTDRWECIEPSRFELVAISLLAAPIRTGSGVVASYGIYRELADGRRSPAASPASSNSDPNTPDLENTDTP
jgi:hypothetical protein